MLGIKQQSVTNFLTQYELLPIRTEKALEFVDLTELIQNLVQQSEIEFGIVNIQTRHTTTGLLLNENEALLLDDFKRQLEGCASAQANYRHDELDLRIGITAARTEKWARAL